MKKYYQFAIYFQDQMVYNEDNEEGLYMTDYDQSLDEKMELIFNAYERTFDIETAMASVELTEEEVGLIGQDGQFQARVKHASLTAKSEVIDGLKSLTDESVPPSTRLRALIEYGTIVFPEKFGVRDEDKKGEEETAQVIIVMPDNGR